MPNFKIKLGAIIVENNKVLLIKERNLNDKKYYWNFIKGTFEADKDKNILNTIKRECREEINVTVKIEKLINVIYYRKNDKIRLQMNFLCSIKAGKPRLSDIATQTILNEDIVEIKKFSRKELLKIKKNEFINERTLITIHDFLNKKFSDLSMLKII